MLDRFLITRLDQLKAMADPLRVRIVEAAIHREVTVADLAARTGHPAGKLYHHIDVLLESGLLTVARRVKKRGTEERWLRAIARDIAVDDAIFAFDQPAGPDSAAMVGLVRSVLEGIGDELVQAATTGAVDPTDPGRRVFLEQQELGLTAAQYQTVFRKVDRWIKEAVRESNPRAARRYRLLVTLFPMASAPAPKRRG